MRVTIDIADDLAAMVETHARRRGVPRVLIHREALNSYFELLKRVGIEPGPANKTPAPRATHAHTAPTQGRASHPWSGAARADVARIAARRRST